MYYVKAQRGLSEGAQPVPMKLEKAYAGYLLLLADAFNEDEVHLILDNSVAIGAITRPHVACFVFFGSARIKLWHNPAAESIENAYEVERYVTPNSLSAVSEGRIVEALPEPLVENPTNKRIQEMTVGTHMVAEWLELDRAKLPAIVAMNHNDCTPYAVPFDKANFQKFLYEVCDKLRKEHKDALGALDACNQGQSSDWDAPDFIGVVRSVAKKLKWSGRTLAAKDWISNLVPVAAQAGFKVAFSNIGADGPPD